jgi:hypothetical protein
VFLSRLINRSALEMTICQGVMEHLSIMLSICLDFCLSITYDLLRLWNPIKPHSKLLAKNSQRSPVFAKKPTSV